MANRGRSTPPSEEKRFLDNVRENDNFDDNIEEIDNLREIKIKDSFDDNIIQDTDLRNDDAFIGEQIGSH